MCGGGSDRFCVRFICTNSTVGHQPHIDSSPGVTPVLLSSHWHTEALTVEPLWGPGHLWEPETQLQLQPRAWFEPWTLAGRA